MSGRPTNMMKAHRSVLAFVAPMTLMMACSDEPRSDERSHPMLHCDGSGSSSFSADFDVSQPGYETVAAAKVGVLDAFVGDFGGNVVEIDDRTLGLLVDGVVVVVAPIVDAPAGGFWNDTFYFCRDFVLQQVGPPDTAPPITT